MLMTVVVVMVVLVMKSVRGSVVPGMLPSLLALGLHRMATQWSSDNGLMVRWSTLRKGVSWKVFSLTMLGRTFFSPLRLIQYIPLPLLSFVPLSRQRPFLRGCRAVATRQRAATGIELNTSAICLLPPASCLPAAAASASAAASPALPLVLLSPTFFPQSLPAS